MAAHGVVHGILGAILLALLVQTWLGARAIPRLHRIAPARGPRAAVLIPARNESSRIGIACGPGPRRTIPTTRSSSSGRRMHQHRAGEQELLDLELLPLQLLEEPRRPAHRHRVVERRFLARQVVVRGEMDERGKLPAVGVGDPLQSQRDAVPVGDVDADAFDLPRRLRLPVAIEADDLEVVAQVVDEPRADEPAASGDDDHGPLVAGR
jgi:hypothetical protein